MNKHRVTQAVCATTLLLTVRTAVGAAQPAPAADVEEVVVTGQRRRFELRMEMLAAEGQDYLAAYRAMLDADENYEPFSTAPPSAGLISAGQVEYQRKMQEIAREQPEFLRALIRYTEIKAKYQSATSTAGDESE